MNSLKNLKMNMYSYFIPPVNILKKKKTLLEFKAQKDKVTF